MIRGVLSVIVSVLLFLSVLVFAVSLDLSLSLTQKNVQDKGTVLASDIVNSIIPGQNLTAIITQNIPQMEIFCSVSPNYTINYQGLNIQLPCQDINKNANVIINDTVKNIINSAYQKNYSCDYWSCLNSQENSPMFLVSQKSHEYWSNINTKVLWISLILIALLFLLCMKKQSALFVTGGILIVASLPLLGLQKLINILPSEIKNIGYIFFSQTNYVLVRMIVAGAVIFIAGIVVELFEAGFKIYDIFHRNEEKEEERKKEKEEIKEELLEEEKEKIKKTKAGKTVQKDENKKTSNKSKSGKTGSKGNKK